MQKITNFFHSLGPGILLAATAIGVSHLVQSVQAGAKYGPLFIIMILLIHIIKYPFFEAAPRYSSVTKKSLLYGYNALNPIYLIIYFFVTLLSLFTILSAVTVVAGGIFANLFSFDLNIKIWSAIILLASFFILVIGKYDFLDNAIKYIILLLSICSIAALYLAFNSDIPKPDINLHQFDFSNNLDILFLIAFLGWMPCPLDCAVWNSLWITAKDNHHSEDVSYKKSITDFRVGFITTALLAIVFLMLGNLMFHGTGVELSAKSIEFVGQFFNVYTENLGQWSFYIIAIAAFFTMFSTVISCLDGYSRTITRSIKLLFFDKPAKKCDEDKLYNIIITLCMVGTLLVISLLISSMKQIVFVATILSFLTAPILAYLNLKLVSSNQIPSKYRISTIHKNFGYLSITILSALAIWFLLTR